MTNNDSQHVVIAITESCPVSRLWEAAIHSARDANAKVITLFLPNQRWQRAASLPFTREISRLGGATVDFTRERARDIDSATIEDVRRRIEALASASHSHLEFRVLSEAEVNEVETIVGTGHHVVVASSVLARRQVLAHFEKLKWQIVLVETQEAHDGSE